MLEWSLLCAGDIPPEEPGVARQLAASSSESSEVYAPVDGAAASSGANSGAGSNSSADWSASPVHYFVMGPRPRWEEAQAWPPPSLGPRPLELFLGSGDSPCAEAAGAAAREVPKGRTGTLSETGPSAAAGAALRWRHDVELWKCPKVGRPWLDVGCGMCRTAHASL